MNRPPVEQLADRLLLLLRKETGRRFPLDELAAALSAESATLLAAAKQLEAWGYTLQTDESSVRLLGTPDILSATELSWNLTTSVIGGRILAFQQVRSTNDIAAREADNGAAEGTVVIADQQTQGRGRLGRVWHSPPGAGAYISIVLRPPCPPEKAPGLSLMTALALAETLEDFCPKQVKIKWPNDVLLDGRKTAGILTELSAEKGRVNHLVVGIGLNINQGAHDFPDDIGRVATSVRIAAGRKIERVALVRMFFERFESEYTMYRQHYLRLSLPRLRYYSSLIGHPVQLLSGSELIEGIAVDIAEDGSLMVDRGGRIMTVASGEVTVVRR